MLSVLKFSQFHLVYRLINFLESHFVDSETEHYLLEENCLLEEYHFWKEHQRSAQHSPRCLFESLRTKRYPDHFNYFQNKKNQFCIQHLIIDCKWSNRKRLFSGSLIVRSESEPLDTEALYLLKCFWTSELQTLHFRRPPVLTCQLFGRLEGSIGSRYLKLLFEGAIKSFY